jgi:hypothetical protein
VVLQNLQLLNKEPAPRLVVKMENRRVERGGITIVQYTLRETNAYRCVIKPNLSCIERFDGVLLKKEKIKCLRKKE